MNERFSIRSVKREYYGGVRDLYRLSVQCNPKGFIQDLEYHGCIINKMRTWRKSGGDLLVAMLGTQVVGMGALMPLATDNVELCKLHVTPQHQGKGIGRRLAERLIRRAKRAGFSAMELHVTVTQQAAIGLYWKLGFRETKQEVYRTTVLGREIGFDTLYMSLAIPQTMTADDCTKIGLSDKMAQLAVAQMSVNQMPEL